MARSPDIKVKVTLTEGYQKRFTEACIKEIEKRRLKEREKKTKVA